MASAPAQSSEDYKAKGNEFFKISQFAEAIEQYTRALEVDRDNAILYSNRSAAYTKLGDYKKALEDASRCIQLKPQWAKGFLRKISALEGFNVRQTEVMEAAAAGFKVTGDSKMKKECVDRWFRANQESNRLPEKSIDLPRGILVLSKEYLMVLFHLMRSLDGVQPLSQELMQQCLFCCAAEMEKVLHEFGEPVSEDIKEWAKYLSCDIYPYPAFGLANRADLEEKMNKKTNALIAFLGKDVDPAIYPILRPLFGLVVLVVINRTNILSNTNTGHHSAEFMNRFLLPLFERSLLQNEDYHSIYMGRLCAILDSFIGRGCHLIPAEISLVKNHCLKLEGALKAYPKHLPEYTKDKQTAELALHNVKHNILLPSASTPASPPEGSPMSVEVARVVVKQRPIEVRAFLTQQLTKMESFKFLTMEDVEELITMAGIFYELNDQIFAVSTFTRGEQAFFKVFGHLLETNALRLDECSATIIPIRQLTLSTASLFIKERPDIFADVLIRWKSLFSEFRTQLIRQGMGSILGDFFQWYTEQKTSTSEQMYKNTNDALLEHMEKEKVVLLRHAVPTLNALSKQSYASVQECLGEGEAVLDYIFFSTFQENDLLEAYCVFFERAGTPVTCILDYRALHRLAGILSVGLSKMRKEKVSKLMEARVKLDMSCLAQILLPQPLHDVLASGRITHLYISPDRDISQLPLASLLLNHDSGAPDQAKLSERMSISILSSSRQLLRQQTTDQLFYSKTKNVESFSTRECCIVANPNFDLQKPADQLPYFSGFVEAFCKIFGISSPKKLADKLQNSEQEAEFICFCLEASNFPVRMLSGDDAILSNILAINNPLLLHISSHAASTPQVSTYRGNFFTDLDSAILLAGYNTFVKEQFGQLVPDAGMGLLPALAVHSMKLKGTRLVFLSTCVSAIGTSPAQESLANLVEPFLAAGAETVIATLWSVEDESAAELSKYFYNKLRNPGVRPSQALAYAKQCMQSDQVSLLRSTSGAFACYGLDWPLVR